MGLSVGIIFGLSEILVELLVGICISLSNLFMGLSLENFMGLLVGIFVR